MSLLFAQVRAELIESGGKIRPAAWSRCFAGQRQHVGADCGKVSVGKNNRGDFAGRYRGAQSLQHSGADERRARGAGFAAVQRPSDSLDLTLISLEYSYRPGDSAAR